MFERLRTLINGPKPAVSMPEPQTWIKGGGTENNPYTRLGFGPEGDRRKNIRRWRDVYRRGGPYADALDAYPLFTLTNGWGLACEEGAETLKDKVQEWLDQPHVDLDSVMWQGILDSVICGTAFQEVLPTRGGDLWGIIPRDAAGFTIQYDDKGRVSGYTQIVEITLGNIKEIPIDPERMLTLTLFPIPGEVYGASILERAWDDIQRDCDITESCAKAIHRHGTPKQQWKIGSEENPASPGDLDDVTHEIETIKANTDFVTKHDTEIVMLDTTGISNVDTYSNVSLQRVACALGVPEEILGLGRGSTEATATVRMQAFLDKVGTIQKIVARTYTRNVIDRITGQPGKVWIEFHDVSPEDEKHKAEWMALLRSGVDPDAVVPADWAREQLGIPPEEEVPNGEDAIIPPVPGSEGSGWSESPDTAI